MKTVISKNKLKKIESMLYASMGAIVMVALMEGRCTDKVIYIRDKAVDDIMKLLLK